MDDKKFGDILAERRKRLGLSIDQAVSATKLRPQVLEAFERSDFKTMPPKGYAQGMLSSYARFLRLDPRDVLEPYFDQLYIYERDRDFSSRSDRSNRYESPYEISRRRTGIGNTGRREHDSFDTEESVSSPRPRRRSSGFSEDRSVGNVYSRYHKSSGSFADDDVYPDDAESSYEPAPRRARVNRRAQLGTGYDEYSNYDKGANKRRLSSRSSNNSGGLGAVLDMVPLPRQVTLAIAGILVLLLLMILLGNLLGSCSKQDEPQAPTTKMVTPQINETQTSEPANPALTSSQTVTGAAQAQNGNTIVKYTVKEGEESYMEIVLDGVSVLAETVKGPKTETFTVKDSITIMANSPRSVQVTKDDKVVAMETVAGMGKVTITAGNRDESSEGSQTAETSKTATEKNNTN